MPNETIALWEHLPRRDVTLDPEMARALGRSGVMDVTPSPSTDGWDLRARQFVGVLRIHDLDLRIHPKVAVGNLLFLLAFAKDQTGWKDLVATLDVSEDLVTAIAMGFVHHATQALNQGVLQGYVTREEALHTVRGRIRTADQVARRYGLPLPIELTYDEFTPDIDENRILLSALRRVTRIPAVPLATVRRARHLQARLEGVSLQPEYRPAEVRYTRLNERYRGAITLGTLILRAKSINFRDGDIATTGFLFDMNRVFEDFVSVALAPHFRAAGMELSTQRWNHLDEEGAIKLRPDLTWWRNGVCLGVADVKYKSLATKELPNADVYQALAYTIAHQLSDGHLVYAAGNESQATHITRHLRTTILVHALDLSREPAGILQGVQELYFSISGHDLEKTMTG